MDTSILPIESIQERDIDLIILEELSINDDFCNWFLDILNLPQSSKYNGVWRSISDFGLGETDLLFSYESNHKRIFLLIENKLDASFQDGQYERYLSRALEYERSGGCNSAFCVLVAPNFYCENQTDFKRFISYECIKEWFIDQDDKRSIFKSELLEIAIEKLRRGYQPVNSEIVQRFWISYWENKSLKFPDFIMKQPKIVPFNSDWPMLFTDALNGVTFYHKWSQGNVDMTFSIQDESIENKIKSILPEKFHFVKHEKSFSIRLKVSKIDRTKDFNSQIESIDLGLQKLEELRKWLIENKPFIF